MFKDLSNQKFVRLLVISRADNDHRGNARWYCRCDCGTEKIIRSRSLLSGTTKSCGCYYKETRLRYGSDNPAWKGLNGRYRTAKGYIRLDNAEYPGAKSGNQAYEHVVVMSRHLGRALLPDETVHHKNGIRDDNRIENLELRASNHGKGQAVPDLIVWAQEVLQRYAPHLLVRV